MKRKTLFCTLLAVLVLALSAVIVPEPASKCSYSQNMIMVADDLGASERTTEK